MNLKKIPTLMLNASYEPLRIIHAQDALIKVTLGKAVVEVPSDREAWPGIYIPSVIRLRWYADVPRRLKVCSRKNIYVRDGYRCQYCGKIFPAWELTLDHIIPKSRGGSNKWENLVACCNACNRHKADRTPEEAGMELIHKPLPANIHTPRFLLRCLGKEIKGWGKYLWVDSKGEV